MSRNRKTIRWVVIAVLAVCAFFAVRYFSRPARNEPVYQGKSLTRWLKQLDDGRAFGISSGELVILTPKQLEAAQAIHAMGTNALPCLMEDIHARPGTNAFRVRLYHWSREHLGNAQIYELLAPTDETEEDRIRWRAAQGLAALGPLAKPGLPELKRLLYTNFWHSSIKEAAYALAAMGPEGVEILTNSVTPTTEWSGMCAIWALGQHPAAGTNCIPFLLSATSSKSQGTAEGAIEVLELFELQARLDARQVVPALTNLLTSQNPELSTRAARSLGAFGHEAVSAVPLLELMTNNPTTRNAAIGALNRIQ